MSLEEVTRNSSSVITTDYICTGIAVVFILLRLATSLTTWFLQRCYRGNGGRLQLPAIFNRHSFRADDIVMLVSIVPLLVRLRTTTFYLYYGTAYDWKQAGGQMDDVLEKQVVLASKLLLLGRWAFITFIWCMKVCVLVFYQRIVLVGDSNGYACSIRALWGTLFLTYVAALVVTFVECRPIELYCTCMATLSKFIPNQSTLRIYILDENASDCEKVLLIQSGAKKGRYVPALVYIQRNSNLYFSVWGTRRKENGRLIIGACTDPCTAATSRLYVYASTDLFTDLWLFAIPLPVLMRVRLPLSRKIQLALLFSVGVFVMVVTIMRIPVIHGPGKGLQKARSFMASLEVAAAAFVANAPILYGTIQTILRRRDEQAPMPEP